MKRAYRKAKHPDARPGQPLYVVSIADKATGVPSGFLSDDERFQYVPIERATRYTHRQAVARANYLAGIGWYATGVVATGERAT